MKTSKTSIFKMAALAVLSASTLVGTVTSASAQTQDGTAKREWRGKTDKARMHGLKKLSLSDAQKAQIKNNNAEARAQIKAIRANTTLSAQEQRSQIAAIRRASRAAMLQVLTPQQRAQMRENRAERKTRGAGVAKLNFSAGQKAQVKNIRQSARTEIQEVRRDTGIPKVEKKSSLQAIRTATRQSIAEVLTPQQRQQVEAKRAARQESRSERRAQRRNNRNS
jgi:Spy/CpxP family protein refolding chaperone